MAMEKATRFKLTMREPAKDTSRHRPTSGTHIPALDGIRGVAILLVMLHHFTFYYYGMRPSVLADRLFYSVNMVGWCGVDLFFVLSGFLITGILFDAKGGIYFFRNFYIRRILRIFPLYYGFLVILFVVLPQVVPLGPKGQWLSEKQGWYWSYLVNVSIAFKGWPPDPFHTIGHFWSLAIEEQFYLCWPMVIFLFRRRHLMLVCLALIVGSFGLRVGLVLGGYPLAAYVLTPARMDALAVGAFLALVARGPMGFASLSRWVRPLAGASATALVAIFLWRRGFNAEDIVVQTFGYSLLACLFGTILSTVVMSSPASTVGKVFANQGLAFFGRYSYALYVFHHPIVIFMRKSGFRVGAVPTVLESQLPGQMLFMIIATSISLAFALLSWHLYEAQFLKLKTLFPYQSTVRTAGKNDYELNPAANA
jgi:peptidoglycan/LPS O-acetylase OafA/YrhL